MTQNKFLVISMDDPKSKKLSEILGNKTCKKIIDFLAENNEVSEKDIADKLKLPLNTVEYNLKKLIEVGLTEKAKTFFWSSRGKRIPTYNLSNKSILISPKQSSINKFKTIIPVALLVGASAFLIKAFYPIFEFSKVAAKSSQDQMLSTASSFAKESTEILTVSASVSTGNLITGFFLLGAALAIILFMIFNWRKMK